MATTNGGYVAIPGWYLEIGDYVRHDGIWYKLTELEYESRAGRRFRGVDRNGGARHLLLDRQVVKAWRAS